MDVLAGRAEPAVDRHSFILPRSKRLITPDGVFGDNSDVLPPERHPGGGIGFVGAGRSAGGDRTTEAAELVLDTVFFDDGLCIGPDESKLFETIMSDVESQRAIASEIAAALRRGASAGEVFERLRPLARHGTPPPPRGPLPSMMPGFASMAIHMLIHHPDAEMLKWFETAAAPSRITLHKAD